VPCPFHNQSGDPGGGVATVQAPLSFDTPEALANPYPLYRRLREEEPVHWETTEQAWLITRYEDVVAALKEPSLSATADVSFIDTLPDEVRERAEPLRAHFGSWMVFSDPPLHTRLKSATQAYLAPKSVAGVRDHLARAVVPLLDDAEHRGSIDALRDFAVPLALVALSHVMGIPESDLTKANEWSESLLEFINVEPGVEQTEKSLKSLLELTEFAARLAGCTHIRPGTLAATLVQSRAEGRLSDVEVVATFAQNITGALGPIPHLVSNGLLALMEYPGELARLHENPSLISAAVEEFLRYDSPFLLVPRTATERLRIRDTFIEPGQRVALMLGAANHDASVFLRPDELDITRTPNRHIAFGIGTHFCLGAHLTRMVARIALAALLERFSSISLNSPAERVPMFGMRSLKALSLTVGR
jgi:cytochrome P450